MSFNKKNEREMAKANNPSPLSFESTFFYLIFIN